MCESDNSILYLFMRPGEPIWVPKGEKRVAFGVPQEYLSERNRPIARDQYDRCSIDGTPIPITKVSALPDLDIPLKLKRDEQFSVFIPRHSKSAAKLIDIFMATETYDEFLSVAAYCRDIVNTQMYTYALSVAIAHHPHTRYLSPPSVYQIFPYKFVPGETIKQARQEAQFFKANNRKPIVLERDHTATDLEPEHRLAYFREDLGVNLHHWHWHVIYPFDADRKIVDKDRRGELFYYMHQQIIARYNFERLSNNFSQVKPFSDFRDPIPEGYFSKLGADMSNGRFPGRQANTILQNINIPSLSFQIQDMERMRDRILDSIHKRYVVVSGQKDNEPKPPINIDTLGNIIESTVLSPNSTFYGDLHNNGHVAIAHSHDPDNRHLESYNVMADNITAMRDPIFYRWHAFINDIFQEYKTKNLVPYTTKELEYNNVKIKEVEIFNENGPCCTFSTHWQQSDVDIAFGLDFASSGPILVRYSHLAHEPFSYRIIVDNTFTSPKNGTVRIFMGPKRTESKPFESLEEQRHFMIELDKWVVKLNPGLNIIDRRSDESSVTIPFEQTFPPINGSKVIGENYMESHYCSCGWPQHMLIPMGTSKGMEVDIFFMISNYDVDKVDREDPHGGSSCCKNAMSYCGRRDKKYPDARAMGYPFDRIFAKDRNTWKTFLTRNMHVVDWKIVFTDETKDPRETMLETNFISDF